MNPLYLILVELEVISPLLDLLGKVILKLGHLLGVVHLKMEVDPKIPIVRMNTENIVISIERAISVFYSYFYVENVYSLVLKYSYGLQLRPIAARGLKKENITS